MQQEPTTPVVGRILATGADAESFLQGQLTQDVQSLAQGRPLWAGYCSPKGRLLAVIRLSRNDEGIVLEMHRGVLEATLKRLRMFVLRSKVTLQEIAAPAVDELTWRRQNILDGVPVVYPATSDHFVPQMVNLDQLGGISFSKGCYTGQEIVARLHYLGNLKRRMFQLSTDNALPAPGAQIYVGEEPQAVGEVVDAVSDNGGSLISAVLQLSHAASEELHLGAEAGGAKIKPAAAYRYAAAG